MKKFEILRYLKRFSMLIFLLTMAGAAMIYLYAQGKQQYTASVVLKYTNDGIKDGYAPDGSDLDVNEIYSSTVIAQAMDSLGASGRLTTVRSNCSVTPIISEEQEKINDALIEKGEEVTYFPDTYKVSLVVDGKLGGPILIAQMVGQQAEQGLSAVLLLAALISVNLGILNLLPIPILDGGHIVFFTLEMIMGRPVSATAREWSAKVGMALLLGLMILATWNDLTRLFS